MKQIVAALLLVPAVLAWAEEAVQVTVRPLP